MYEPRGLALVLQVLRREPDRSERRDVGESPISVQPSITLDAPILHARGR
jgi:hypothetical protein